MVDNNEGLYRFGRMREPCLACVVHGGFVGQVGQALPLRPLLFIERIRLRATLRPSPVAQRTGECRLSGLGHVPLRTYTTADGLLKPCKGVLCMPWHIITRSPFPGTLFSDSRVVV